MDPQRNYTTPTDQEKRHVEGVSGFLSGVLVGGGIVLVMMIVLLIVIVLAMRRREERGHEAPIVMNDLRRCPLYDNKGGPIHDVPITKPVSQKPEEDERYADGFSCPLFEPEVGTTSQKPAPTQPSVDKRNKARSGPSAKCREEDKKKTRVNKKKRSNAGTSSVEEDREDPYSYAIQDISSVRSPALHEDEEHQYDTMYDL